MTQNEYLEILFNDCGFNRAQRNDFLSLRTGRTITNLDDLTGSEKHRFIDDLKKRKEPVLPRDPEEDDLDDDRNWNRRQK